MGNPLMNMMGNTQRMNSPIANGLNSFGKIQQIMNMLRGGNPAEIAANMARQNPEFAKFVEANKNKSVEQLANEYGIDLNMLNGFLK